MTMTDDRERVAAPLTTRKQCFEKELLYWVERRRMTNGLLNFEIYGERKRMRARERKRTRSSSLWW